MPTPDQSVLIKKHIGASRFIFNLALETKQLAWSMARLNMDCFDLIKQLPDLKKECEWLSEINSQSLQQPIRNLDNAFTRFFKGQVNYPNFKKKKEYGNFNVPQNVIIDDKKIVIPKFKEGIKIILHRPIIGKIKQATISLSSTGKYFVSVLCETSDSKIVKNKIQPETAVGIDLGLKDFIVTSNGHSFDNPKFLKKSIKKVKYLQKKHSIFKGKRTRVKLNILHEKIVNKRKDFLNKTSTTIINNHDTICVENLSITNMVKNHNLAQSINDASWGKFIDMLNYKADQRGKNILVIGRFEPSSKMCSSCGSINKLLTLRDRFWTCSCGITHNRDYNAALNIKNFALRNHLSVGRRLKNQKELPTLVGVMTSEA